jgi:hypothetical protein
MSHRLQLEILEPRLAMTATLTGGVLSIVGTSDADTITVQYNADHLTILGESFAMQQVKAINIATGDGNDTVQFSSIGPNSTSWIGKRVVTVLAQEGDDRFIGPSGQSVYFGGQDVFDVDRKGRSHLNGKTPSWFDQTIADAEIRSLVKQDFADRVLSRSDMLDLFDHVSEDSTISATQFAGLQAIVNNTALYKKLTYVQTLAGYVVNGSVANATFQGDTLGNLTAGSPGEQLEKLVDKWFLGQDHPVAEDLDTHEIYQYQTAAGELFVNGISYADISQGALGDCYLLAGLGAVAVQSTKPIANMFIINGDGTYTIRFYNGATPYFVTVDSQLPTDTDGRLMFAGLGQQIDDPTNELWVPLIEKAYAQLDEFGWLTTFGPVTNVNAYTAIDTGYPSDVVAQITGKAVDDSLVLDNPRVIANAFASGRAITLTTFEQPLSPNIVDSHAYALLGYNSKTREFVVFNPWGLDNGQAPGIVSLTWEEMQQNFYSWDFGPKV